MWFAGIIGYIYVALCVHLIANKTETPHPWMAWIPILNLYLWCKIAGKPGWWLILLLIPLVQIVMGIIVWMGISKARGKPEWMGVLVALPFFIHVYGWYFLSAFVGIVSLVGAALLGYLAFTE